jgi:hypothetical protein
MKMHSFSRFFCFLSSSIFHNKLQGTWVVVSDTHNSSIGAKILIQPTTVCFHQQLNTTVFPVKSVTSFQTRDVISNCSYNRVYDVNLVVSNSKIVTEVPGITPVRMQREPCVEKYINAKIDFTNDNVISINLRERQLTVVKNVVVNDHMSAGVTPVQLFLSILLVHLLDRLFDAFIDHFPDLTRTW